VGIEVRTITDDELEDWIRGVRVGFLSQPVPEETEIRRPFLQLDRCWAAFDGGRVVGTLRSLPGQFTVPGGASVTTACLTAVTVTATHRRRGLLRSMIEPDLRGSKERGEPIGALIAAEWPIYGRFGYGAATEHVTFLVDAARARLRNEPSGSVELVDAPTIRGIAPDLHARHTDQTWGELHRLAYTWDWRYGLAPNPFDEKADKNFYVVARDRGGQPSGYANYKIKSDWEGRVPKNTAEVEELVALTPDALATLWQYLMGIDWVTVVQVEDRGPDDLLPWLLVDARHARRHEQADFLWVRLLDTAAAMEARRYTTDGRFVMEVVDGQGLASGRFVVEGGPDGATCSPTTESADLTLTAEAIGAAYMGGVALATLQRAGLVDEHSAGSIQRADAMIVTPVRPWCSTWF
jgi:predicted acetyltransferase